MQPHIAAAQPYFMKLRNIFIQELLQGYAIVWKAARKYTAASLLLHIALALLPLTSLWCIKQAVDIITRQNPASKQQFIYTIIILAAIQLLQSFLQQLLNYTQTIQQQLVTDHLSRKVLEKAVSVEYSYYENTAYFDSLHQAQQQVLYRTGILTTGFNQLIQHSLTLISLCGLFLFLNWLYAVIIILAGIPVLAVKWKHATAAHQLEKKNILAERKAAYLNRVLTDPSHAKEVRTYDSGSHFISWFRELREAIFSGKRKLSLKQGRSDALVQAIEILTLSFIIFNLGMRSFNGTLTAGSFILYLQALQKLQSGFKSFLTSFTLLFQQRFFLKHIFGFLGLPPMDKPSAKPAVGFPEATQEGLVLEDVCFTYPGSTHLTLDRINMRFEPGKVTAIIGENGSGKSTLVKLLARLYPLTAGAIRIGKEHVTHIRADDYYANLSVIFQDFCQYHLSVADNISPGRKADTAKTETALDISGLRELIESFPRGLSTGLGRMFGKDIQLSGGQWQKIAIARLLYRDAKVMILDEPTSNIDPLAEYEILKKINEAKKDKIIILITHRLHNLKFADHVYLLDDGKIQAEGSVENLLIHNELFRQMYERQKLSTGELTII